MKRWQLAPIAVAVTALSSWLVLQAQELPACPDVARAIQDLMRSDSRLRDFAQLARYRDSNRAAVNPTVEQRVIFLGDSITDFWAQPRFGGFFPGKPYLNRGISGQTTAQMLLRFRHDVINLKPRVVVVLAGTNDIAGNTGPASDEEIESNLTDLSELAHANHIQLVLATILPVSNYHQLPPDPPMTQRRPPARIKNINRWLQTYSAAHGYVFLDYYTAMIDQNGMLARELSEDGLHPTVKGYAIMAPLAEAAIQKALSH